MRVGVGVNSQVQYSARPVILLRHYMAGGCTWKCSGKLGIWKPECQTDMQHETLMCLPTCPCEINYGPVWIPCMYAYIHTQNMFALSGS